MSKFMETELALKTGVSGHFLLQVLNPDGTIKQEVEFDNLITNTGMDKLAGGWPSSSSVITQATVGTGTTTPAYTDTALAIPYGDSSNNSVSPVIVNPTTEPYITTASWTYTFNAGTFYNTTIREVGMKNGFYAGLFCRALITDANGNPSPITLASSDTLNITYTLKIVPPETDIISSFSISSTPYTATIRPLALLGANNTGWMPLGTFSTGLSLPLSQSGGTTYPSIKQSNDTALTSKTTTYTSPGTGTSVIYTAGPSYVSGTFYKDFSFRWPLAYANLANGIRKVDVEFIGGGIWQMLFDQFIPKTSSNSLTLNMRVSIGRV